MGCAGLTSTCVLAPAQTRKPPAHSLSLYVRASGLVTALALAMLTDRALLVRDFSPEGFFGSFAPEFDCEGTAERVETAAAIPGCRHVSAARRHPAALRPAPRCRLFDTAGPRFRSSRYHEKRFRVRSSALMARMADSIQRGQAPVSWALVGLSWSGQPMTPAGSMPDAPPRKQRRSSRS